MASIPWKSKQIAHGACWEQLAGEAVYPWQSALRGGPSAIKEEEYVHINHTYRHVHTMVRRAATNHRLPPPLQYHHHHHASLKGRIQRTLHRAEHHQATAAGQGCGAPSVDHPRSPRLSCNLRDLFLNGLFTQDKPHTQQAAMSRFASLCCFFLGETDVGHYYKHDCLISDAFRGRSSRACLSVSGAGPVL